MTDVSNWYLYEFCSQPAEASVCTGGRSSRGPADGMAKPVLDEAGLVDGSESAYTLLGIGASEYRMGRPKQALELLLEAAARLASMADHEAQLEALLLCGRAQRDLGLPEEAAQHFQEALELARRDNNQSRLVDALNLLAGLLSSQGDHFAALENLGQALNTAREAGLAECQADILNNMGSLRSLLGDYSRALAELQSAYQLLRTFPVRSRSEAVNRINLGHLYRDTGDLKQAQELYALARETGRALNDHMVEVVSLNSLANILARSGEWVSARELYHEALQMARRFGFSKYEVDNLDGLGQAHTALGEHQRAIAEHRQALLIARRISDPEGELDSLTSLGRSLLATGQTGEAIQALIEAYDCARALDRKEVLADAHELLGQAYEQKNDLARALAHQREMHALKVAMLTEKCEQRSTQLSVLYESEYKRREAETQRLQRLQKERDEAEARMAARTRELERSQVEIVERLATAAEYRDDETGEHPRRVASIAASIAEVLGWPEEEVKLISKAARLHDVGKLGVRDAILLKPGKLTNEEFSLVRAHTCIGANILSGSRSRFLRMAEEIALSHHERWDGKGYPLGLTGEQTPLSARIVAVADAYDALLHERPYKRAWSTEEALAEISLQSGRQFDPNVVKAFLEAIENERGMSHTSGTPAPATRTPRPGRAGTS